MRRRKLQVDGSPGAPPRDTNPEQPERRRTTRSNAPRKKDARDDDYKAPARRPVSLDADLPVVFSGFDEAKLSAPLRLGRDGMPVSAKYTFAKLAMKAKLMPQTHQQAEDWFNTNIREGLETKGFRVGWVRGDQALIGTRENPAGELISFLRGVGSKIPGYLALTWENEATRAAELEVTQLADDPVANDPLLKVQAEIAKSLAREEQAYEDRLQSDLRKQLRATRLPNKG